MPGGAGGIVNKPDTLPDVLKDGGVVPATFSPMPGRVYRVPVGGTVTLPTPTGSGKLIVLIIGGSGVSTLAGVLSAGGTIVSSLAVDGDQTLVLGDYDATRGWV